MAQRASTVEDKDTRDIIDARLDQCYREWHRTYKWLPVLAYIICWIPTASYCVMTFGNLAWNHIHVLRIPGYYQIVQSSIWGYTAGIPTAVIFSITVASAAASCYRFGDDFRTIAARELLYQRLRSKVRSRVYGKILWLLALPLELILVSFVILNYIEDHTTALWLVLIPVGLLIAAICIYIAELIQYFTLAYSPFNLIFRIMGQVGYVLVMLAACMLVLGLFGTDEYPYLNVLVSAVIPAAIAFWLQDRTRRPSPTLLERL